MQINETAWPVTQSSLCADLSNLGISRGMVLIMHSSLKSLDRWIVGGPVAVILALEELLGDKGTLIMPTHTGDLSDPEHWINPPVPQEWWNTIKKETPAFDKHLTPTSGMGVVVEAFRSQSGTLRSDHPHVSFAAHGEEAAFITENHTLAYSLGEESPLARIYDKNGWILLFGVDHINNTSIHLAEYRADFAGKKQVMRSAPYMVNGQREWVTFEDINFSSDDFMELGIAFEQESGLVRVGTIGNATVKLIPQRELVDFAVRWMGKNRTEENAC